jgi:hypothetical protein
MYGNVPSLGIIIGRTVVPGIADMPGMTAASAGAPLAGTRDITRGWPDHMPCTTVEHTRQDKQEHQLVSASTVTSGHVVISQYQRHRQRCSCKHQKVPIHAKRLCRASCRQLHISNGTQSDATHRHGHFSLPVVVSCSRLSGRPAPA